MTMPRPPNATESDPHKYVEPHERKDGPWDEYELDDAGRHIERAEKIKGNPKFVEAIAKHHEKKAKTHSELADKTRGLRKSGHISEKALMNAEAKRHGKQE